MPTVERLSIDEAFLDARGLEHIKGSPPRWPAAPARRARTGRAPDQRGRGADQVPRQGGQRPGQARRAAGGAARQGAGLPAPAPRPGLWGVGPATAEKLHAQGLRTVGEVATPESPARGARGAAAGRKLHALAHNRDPRPVKRTPRRRSVGSQCALGQAVLARDAGRDGAALVDRVTRRMSAKGRAGRTVVLRMRFGDFGRATRSHTLPSPTAATSAVLAEMRALLAADRELIEERGLTMVGVTVANLEAGSRQLQLPIDERHGDVLDHVLDEVRDRFGATARSPGPRCCTGRRGWPPGCSRPGRVGRSGGAAGGLRGT